MQERKHVILRRVLLILILILNLAWCRMRSETERHTDCESMIRLLNSRWSAAGKFPSLQVFGTEVSRFTARMKTTMTGLLHIINNDGTPSHHQQWWDSFPSSTMTGLLPIIVVFILILSFRFFSKYFVATRMSAGISDWSTFEVCIAYACLIWED